MFKHLRHKKLNHPLHQVEINFVTNKCLPLSLYKTSGILYYSTQITWFKPYLCPNSTITTKHHELIARQTRSVKHTTQNSPQQARNNLMLGLYNKAKNMKTADLHRCIITWILASWVATRISFFPSPLRSETSGGGRRSASYLIGYSSERWNHASLKEKSPSCWNYAQNAYLDKYNLTGQKNEL